MSTSGLTDAILNMPRPPFPHYKGPDDLSSGFTTDDEALEAWEAECEAYLEKYGGATVRDPWEEVPMMSPDGQTVRLFHMHLLSSALIVIIGPATTHCMGNQAQPRQRS